MSSPSLTVCPITSAPQLSPRQAHRRSGLPQKVDPGGKWHGESRPPSRSRPLQSLEGWYPHPRLGGCHLTGDHQTTETSAESKLCTQPSLGPCPCISPSYRGSTTHWGLQCPPTQAPFLSQSPSGTCSIPCTCWKLLWVSGVGPPQNVKASPPPAPAGGALARPRLPHSLHCAHGPLRPAPRKLWMASLMPAPSHADIQGQGCGGGQGHRPDS